MDSQHLDVEKVDVDGGLRESAERAHFELERAGDTRAGFFKKAGLAGGAVLSGGAILGALVPGSALGQGNHPGPKDGRPPRGAFGKGDIGILNYALTLEYLERAFYDETEANNSQGTPFITDTATQDFLAATVRDERAHVDALEGALGNKAVDEPNFDFGPTTSNQSDFQNTALALENTGVSAYLGQAYNIEKKAIGKVALSIVTIEARHSGLIGQIVDGSDGIAPDGPFDKPKTAREVLRIVRGTGFIVGNPQ